MISVYWMPTFYQELHVYLLIYFSFHVFHFTYIHHVGTWGSKEFSPWTRATKWIIWIGSRSTWLWNLVEFLWHQLSASLSWYQVTYVVTHQTGFISPSGFALETDSSAIHLTYGKKSTNIQFGKSHALPGCQFHANVHQTCWGFSGSTYLIRLSICLCVFFPHRIRRNRLEQWLKAVLALVSCKPGFAFSMPSLPHWAIFACKPLTPFSCQLLDCKKEDANSTCRGLGWCVHHKVQF